MKKEKYCINNSAEGDVNIIIELTKDEANLLEKVFDQLNNSYLKQSFSPTITIIKYN